MKKYSNFVIMTCAAFMMIGTVAIVSSCSGDDDGLSCECKDSKGNVYASTASLPSGTTCSEYCAAHR